MERRELERRGGELHGLTRAHLTTPEASLDQAFVWAARHNPAGIRADPGSGPEWDADAQALLLEWAKGFKRVGSAALPGPETLIRHVVAGLFGVRADAAGGRYEIRPWLPEGWRAFRLRGLRCHRTVLDLDIRARADWATVRLEREFGPSIPLVVGLRNVGPIGQVTVDEVPVEGDRAVLTLLGEHEIMFFFRGARE
ncbi:MAG: hypothetical protein ACT4PM_03375 [Gemmatimonadales bacterium]